MGGRGEEVGKIGMAIRASSTAPLALALIVSFLLPTNTA
jgi:hypothetical protein